jgi:crotonobetainyl-CoA:carnitine CoA-transferase CaiB-like acyl-CoA transferase
MVTEVIHSKLGPVKTLGFPVKLSASPARIERGAPLLGEHTREVLLAHGYTEAAVEELRNAGVIICGV